MHRMFWKALTAVAVYVPLAACDESRPTAPRVSEPSLSTSDGGADVDAIVREVRELAAARGIGPLPATPRIRQPLVLLGRLLAFDPILSGGRDISCMTCHVPAFATGDGKSLSVGQGGAGLGPDRSHPNGVFIPRNAPPLFNLAAMRRLFWDGRVEVDSRGELQTPVGPHVTPAMARVFEFGATSALALFR